MGYFPFFIDIKNRSCLIVGGGSVAYRKVKRLIPYEPAITVVSPEFIEDFKELENSITVKNRTFEDSDIENMLFVISATDDKELNGRISELCKSRNIPVNVVDSRDECSFIFPSLFKKGDLSIGISTGGASPNLAVHYRNILERNSPSSVEDILDFMDRLRTPAKEKISDNTKRRQFFKECLDICMDENRILSQEETEELFKKYSDEDFHKKGFVHLVGAGCGKADLITVRGINCIQNAEVLIYDDLIADGLTEITTESCEKIYVGKRGGRKYISQDEICKIIVEKANEGKNVVRLKGGDPFVFGRGGEEIAVLQKNNIPFEEVPGITSAIAIPAEAGIPVTHRGYSRSFHVITGHTVEDTASENMESLAKLNGTLVFLMGLSKIEEICSSLMENGKDENTPAAVISGGNSKNKVTVRSTLKNIAEECRKQEVLSPVVIVIGSVAELDFK